MVPLCAVNATALLAGKHSPGFELSPIGLLTVPVSATPDEVYDFVNESGGAAAGILTRKAREEAEIKTLVETVGSSPIFASLPPWPAFPMGKRDRMTTALLDRATRVLNASMFFIALFGRRS